MLLRQRNAPLGGAAAAAVQRPRSGGWPLRRRTGGAHLARAGGTELVEELSSLGPSSSSSSSSSSSAVTSTALQRAAPLAAAPPAPAYPPGFEARRLVVFGGMLAGYACYYLTRNSLTYSAPTMVADASLGLDIGQLGALASCFPLAYGASKLASGVLGARASPAALLAGGLAGTAAANAALASGGGLPWFCSLWALNGALQGVGGPACARMLTAWFPARERGTYWAAWNIAHNLGGFAAPLVAGGCAATLGWRWGFWAPAALAAAVSGVVLLACKDSPEAAGFPPVEPRTAAAAAPAPAPASAAAAPAPAPAPAPDAAAAPAPKSVWDALVGDVLSRPELWGLAAAYFFVYLARQGAATWLVFYLLDAGAADGAADAALRVSGLELGGLAGGVLAGRASDALIARAAARGDGAVGKRVQVVMAYVVGVALALAAVRAAPAGTDAAGQWLAIAGLGFFLYGPQLIGLCGAEIVAQETVGAAEGLLGFIAYAGAAAAGAPLAALLQSSDPHRWDSYFSVLTAACGAALLLLAPLTGLPSHAQLQQRRGKQQAAGGRARRREAAVDGAARSEA
ncbi:hypothetical protein Rsub_13356 [Raphidocelis subcapitata]|uniref:Major facilitator superfamily (MFS) profile domain-containing protein n=1 Tax=Raphidocelis subcapitata TaxID=307507 RepID=A0A2V0PLC4_9CHLO|nr:hypothetical protein Rsub_13356 [Raphidocelis subcapitata]|eukprot:GBG00575.1 hypothetical protein Rsub_13356 [Raphidocelis subcapitata]